MYSSKKRIRLSESDYTQDSINDIIITTAKTIYHNFKQNNDTQSIDRGAINDMGFWYDVIQPLVDEISERYGLSFNQSAKIYQKAWDIAFDKLDNNNINNNNMNTRKNTIRLTESRLRNIIMETVKRALKESADNAHYGVSMFDIDTNQDHTDWDFAWEDFTLGDALAEAESFVSNNPDLGEYAVVYDKNSGKRIKTFYPDN